MIALNSLVSAPLPPSFCETVHARVNGAVLAVLLDALLLPQTMMTDVNNLDGCFPQQVSKYEAEDH